MFCSLIGNGCSRGTGPSAPPWFAASPNGVWRVATPPRPTRQTPAPPMRSRTGTPHHALANWTRPSRQPGRVPASPGDIR